MSRNKKVDWPRTFLIMGMAATAFMLVLEWNKYSEGQLPAPKAEATVMASSSVSTDYSSQVSSSNAALSDNASDIPASPEEEAEEKVIAPVVNQQLIHVVTDNLDLLIDTHGGDIVKVGLPKHFAQIDTPDVPFTLLNRTESQTYVAQSGLVGSNGTDSAAGRPVFQSNQTEYRLAEGRDELTIDLTLEQDNVTITKRFIFKRSDYLINIEYLIDNRSQETWKANFYAQVKRDSTEPAANGGGLGMQPFLGTALTTIEENYKKFSFDDIEEESFKTEIKGGWVAMVQHYFFSAWIADQDIENNFHLRKIKDKDLYLFGFTSPRTEVAAGSLGKVGADFYVGPKDVYRLEEIAPYLDLTVDYGWLWWVAKPLFRVLNWIYSFLGNWGLSIIILTVMIKAVFYPLSAASYRSMAKMRQLQPMMATLKERFGDDRQKMSSELMKLYKKEGVNPMGGCLPILIQMPVFISLYWVLMESVELRHTPFLWMLDLSIKDPYFILPLVMGLTMFIQQKLNPTPPDPMQARIMQMMPVVFTFMFMWFPAGLVLYWVVNNTLSIAQQYTITKQIEAAAENK